MEAVQISGQDNKDRNILSVIVKKCYIISSTGICTPENKTYELSTDFIFDEKNSEKLLTDSDLYYSKLYTDVVVKGHVYGDNKDARIKVEIEISGQKNKFSFLVFGNRKAYLNEYGKLVFSNPEPIEKIPLEYHFAYGGIDTLAEQKFEQPSLLQQALPDIDWNTASPYRYARNSLGKGFVIEKNKQTFENFDLPNFEDPIYLLTPENLLVGEPENWIFKPIPKCTDWVNPSWFPRLAYFGFLPEFSNKMQLRQLPEYLQALVENDILEDKPFAQKLHHRAANGASLGLQLPYLNGNETIRLANIHPLNKNFVFKLPAERPKIWIDGRKGKLLETNPVIHTVCIEPDEHRLSIVWCGSGPALRPYMDEELKTMPFKVEWK